MRAQRLQLSYTNAALSSTRRGQTIYDSIKDYIKNWSLSVAVAALCRVY